MATDWGFKNRSKKPLIEQKIADALLDRSQNRVEEKDLNMDREALRKASDVPMQDSVVQKGKEDTQISMKLSSELLQRCERAAKEASMSRSAYVKFALNKFLKEEGF